MKTDIHPQSRKVLFHDIGVDTYFLINSTVSTTQTKEWEDGNTYPYYALDVSSASHPFYTGKQKMLDSGGRVKKFQDRFGASGSTKLAEKKEAPKSKEAVAKETTEEVEEVVIEAAEETSTETEEVMEEAQPEEVSKDSESTEEEINPEEAKD